MRRLIYFLFTNFAILIVLSMAMRVFGIELYQLMITEDKGRIALTKKEGILGLITRNGIARYVQIEGK